MSLRPAVFILLARWRIVVLATLSCLAGGGGIILTAEPAYRATARVTVDFLRPDPETGVVLGKDEVEAFVMSQLAMIHDQQIAGPAAEALGWLDDPDFQIAYAARPPGDRRDFRNWAAAQIVAGTAARQVPESNILEISYRAATPELAEAVVEAVRRSYIDMSVAFRRQQAASAADSLARRADQLRSRLAAAEQRQAVVQDETGVVFNRGGSDLESVRLGVMANAGQDPLLAPSRPTGGATRMRLLAVQAALADADRLGPNHPRRRELEQQEALLKAEIAREELLVASAGMTAQAAANMRDSELAAQTSKVISRREDVLKAQTAKDEVEIVRGRLVATLKDVADLRLAAASTEGPVAASGPASASPRPVFPNPALILGGTATLGLLVGSLLSFLTEFFDRRVRDARMLATAARAPVIGRFPAERYPGRANAVRETVTMFEFDRQRRSAIAHEAEEI